MKIIISEDKEELLINQLIKEDTDYSYKILLLKNYLDKNFVRCDSTDLNSDGKYVNNKLVAMVNNDGKILKTLTDVQLFYLIQDGFKKLMGDKEERDDFIKTVIKAWYNKKITDGGVIKH